MQHRAAFDCQYPGGTAPLPSKCRYQKLQGRLKEEKRAAKLLRVQLADERAATAELALSRLSLPRLVGLDLSASNLGELGGLLN